jgi:pimeloyl-ACP methyl ester carboxylesterase
MTIRRCTVRQWAAERGLSTDAGFLIRLGQQASTVYSELASSHPEFDPGRAKTWEEIPGAGHWVHVDAPEATFAAVERALGSAHADGRRFRAHEKGPGARCPGAFCLHCAKRLELIVHAGAQDIGVKRHVIGE